MAIVEPYYENGKLKEGVSFTESQMLERKNTVTVTGAGNGKVIITGALNDKLTVKAGATNYSIKAGEGKNTINTERDSSVKRIETGAGADSIHNYGIVAGDIVAGAGADKITVEGRVNGNVTAIGIGNNTVKLLNDIGGYVQTGEGADKITLASGYKVTKDINAGAGNNTITVNGIVGGTITATTGNDKITVGAGATTSAINVGDGNNTITVNGASGNITAGAGTDKVTVGKTASAKVINVGKGNNTVTANGSVGDIIAADGNDKITVAATGKAGNISAGDGNNTITVNAASGNITAGAGTDKITIGKGIKVGNINAGNGNNTITINGSSGNITGGAGNDKITLNWANYSNSIVINTGAGTDSITIKGAKVGEFALKYSGQDLVMTDTKGKSITVKNWQNIVKNGNLTGITFADGKKSIVYLDNKVSLDNGKATATVGKDTISLTDSTLKIGKDSFTAPKNVELRTGADVDTVKISGSSGYKVYGEDGNDKITVSGGDSHKVYGDNGDDTITITGGNNITAQAGAGNDIITVSSAVLGARYDLSGGAGKDTYKLTKLTANSQYDIDNSGSKDIVDVLDLRNYKVAEFEVSRIKNEPGAIKLVHKPTNSTTHIRGLDSGYLEILFKDYTAKFDTVNGVLSGNPIYVAPPAPYNGVPIKGSSGDDTISNNGIYITGPGSASKTVATTTNVIISGLDGNDTILLQNRGNCRITGDAGDDYLAVLGNPGMGDSDIPVKKVYINGGIGNDVLSASFAGSEVVLKGGSGNDDLSIMGVTTGSYPNFGTDPIINCYANGEIGNDKFVVADARDCLIAGGVGDDSITLNTVDHSKVYGGDNDDTFQSWNACSYNYLDGGAGNDSFNIDGGTSNTTIVGGTGSDRYNVDHRANCYIKVTDAFDTLNLIAYNGASNYYKINSYVSTYDSARDIMKISYNGSAICVEGFSKLQNIYLGSNKFENLGYISYTANSYISAASSAGKYLTGNLSDAMLSFGENGMSVDVNELANTLDQQVFPGIKNEIIAVASAE